MLEGESNNSIHRLDPKILDPNIFPDCSPAEPLVQSWVFYQAE